MIVRILTEGQYRIDSEYLDRLNEIENPVVRQTPSKAAIKVRSVRPNARARARGARSAGSSR